MGDNGNKILVDIQSAPYLLDKDGKGNIRMVLGYVAADYDIDNDAEVIVFFKRGNEMQWESLSPITLSKDAKRFYQKLPLIGSIIDFYIQLTGEFTNFQLSSLKLNYKTAQSGKYS